MSAGGLHYEVRLSLAFGAAVPSPAPAYPPRAIRDTGPGWYRGDCHPHSIFSDGSQRPADIADRARAAGLAFIVSTEHNTPAAHGVWGRLADDDLLIMVGEEVTTRNDHLLALGLDPGCWIDWRFRVADGQLDSTVSRIHDRGGLAVAAHPHARCVGGRWKFGFGGVDAIEVWNGAWSAEERVGPGRLGRPTHRP